MDHQETNPGNCQSKSNLELPDCKSHLLITRSCCLSVGNDKFIFMFFCFLDKFEASKGLNCCCSETWSCWQISNSTNSKKAGKECFPLCFLIGRDSSILSELSVFQVCNWYRVAWFCSYPVRHPYSFILLSGKSLNTDSTCTSRYFGR